MIKIIIVIGVKVWYGSPVQKEHLRVAPPSGVCPGGRPTGFSGNGKASRVRKGGAAVTPQGPSPFSGERSFLIRRRPCSVRPGNGYSCCRWDLFWCSTSCGPSEGCSSAPTGGSSLRPFRTAKLWAPSGGASGPPPRQRASLPSSERPWPISSPGTPSGESPSWRRSSTFPS